MNGARYAGHGFRVTGDSFRTASRSPHLYHAALLYALFVLVASWWIFLREEDGGFLLVT